MKVSSDFNKIKKEWDNDDITDFIRSSFLEIFYSKHQNIDHIFILEKEFRIYGHLLTLRFTKISNYLNHKILAFVFQFFKFKILYLTNSFITNVPSFISKNKIDLDNLLFNLNNSYNLLILPDFFYDYTFNQKKQFFKIEVDPEMVVEIKDNWSSIEDYLFDLKKKYRKKIQRVLKLSDEIKIRPMNSRDLEKYSDKIQELQNNIIKESSFHGPIFNTDSFQQLNKKEFFIINGYFFKDELVAFASEIHQDKTLYSYYVGFDKDLNKRLALYPRILIEKINSAIKLKKNKLVLGRTASEFKSNFGAIPKKSFIYIYIKNIFIRNLLMPIIKRLKVKSWQQRNPFKGTT